MVGLYDNNVLIKTLQSDKKTSDGLIEILEPIINKFNIQRVIYTNSPGSFMGLKVSYIILKTLCMVKGYQFLSVSGFLLNSNMPIRANKNLSFVRNGEDIILQKVDPVDLKMPDSLSDLKLSIDTLPQYIIKAI